jgi:hypothetical protein
VRSLSLATVALGLVAWVASARAAEPAEKLLYTRADIVTAATGEASLRRAYTRQMELPSETCAGGPFTCATDRLYGQVYMLAFFEETVSRGADGKAMLDRRERGRLTLALDLSKEAENRFEDAVLAHLEQLGVAAFARPWASMRFLDEPLGQRSLRQSAAPVWVCTELDGAYGYDLLVIEGDKGERSYSGSGDAAKSACRAIEGAVKDAEPTLFRTIPDIRAQLRQDVRLASFSNLDGLTWANRLVTVPGGATFKKLVLGGDRKTGAVRDFKDGVFVGNEGRYGAVARDARLPRANLELAEVPMWVTRWTFDATRERFGKDPRTERDPRVSFLVAVAPVSDPLMDKVERARIELFVPEHRVIAAAIARLAESATLGPSSIVDALTDPTIWPSSGDWMIVTCRDDGSARYGLAPFADAAEVANPRDACAAIRRQIGE